MATNTPDPTPVIPDGLPRCNSNHALSLIQALQAFKEWFDAHGCPFCQIDNYQAATANALKDQRAEIILKISNMTFGGHAIAVGNAIIAMLKEDQP